MSGCRPGNCMLLVLFAIAAYSLTGNCAELDAALGLYIPGAESSALSADGKGQHAVRLNRKVLQLPAGLPRAPGSSLGAALGITDIAGQDIGSLVSNAISASRADAAATAISAAPGRGEATAAATSLVQQTQSGHTDAVASAIAAAAARNAAATASVLAQAAATASSQGATNSFAQAQAQAFSKARSQGSLSSYTESVAQAITQGGGSAQQSFGQAFATAAASGGDQRQALVEATATAMCSGGCTATAFASAFSVAISQDKNGCVVLSEARAIAVARCGEGQVSATAQASATTRVLGLCGMTQQLLPFGFNAGFGSGQSMGRSGSG